jgi:hypothetical protein
MNKTAVKKTIIVTTLIVLVIIVLNLILCKNSIENINNGTIQFNQDTIIVETKPTIDTVQVITPNTLK